jgi:hypothetical protein
MKLSSEKEAIIGLMNDRYQQILPMEAEWGIRFKEGDMRPRIEHFHDAVRAYMSGSVDIYAKHSRLSVEHLAFDLGQLRQIQEKPLGTLHRGTEKSTGSALVKLGLRGEAPPKTPPSSVRQELVAQYKTYAVFYAALFAEVADRNFKSRQDALDNDVGDIGMIETMLQQLAAGQLTQTEALQESHHIERDDLRERIQQMLASKKLTAAEKQEALGMIGGIERGLKEESKKLDASHTSYVTGQLAVYEENRDMIKKMAASGLNMAGKFLQQAVSTAQGKGRGV